MRPEIKQTPERIAERIQNYRVEMYELEHRCGKMLRRKAEWTDQEKAEYAKMDMSATNLSWQIYELEWMLGMHE